MILNPKTIGRIEDFADDCNKGSIFRACLAIQRCTQNKYLSAKIFQLGYNYVYGLNTITQLLEIVEEYFPNSDGEFREAIQALKNAIDFAPLLNQ